MRKYIVVSMVYVTQSGQILLVDNAVLLKSGDGDLNPQAQSKMIRKHLIQWNNTPNIVE